MNWKMVKLIEMGVPNIVCMQPFACLSNHIVVKDVIKSLRQNFPSLNVVAIDYDLGAGEVNQLNRIKLMLATPFENLGHDSVEKINASNIFKADTEFPMHKASDCKKILNKNHLKNKKRVRLRPLFSSLEIFCTVI